MANRELTPASSVKLNYSAVVLMDSHFMSIYLAVTPKTSAILCLVNNQTGKTQVKRSI